MVKKKAKKSSKKFCKVVKDDPFTSCQIQLKKAIDVLKMGDDVYEVLKEVDEYKEVKIPVRMDNGKIKVFKGYRSHHNNARGPYKGGIRFHPDVNISEVKASKSGDSHSIILLFFTSRFPQLASKS